MSTLEVGDLLYEYSLKFTKVTEYGFSMGDLLAGKAPPPPGGARFDVAIEGSASGPKLKGSVVGVDYLEVRADGRFPTPCPRGKSQPRTARRSPCSPTESRSRAKGAWWPT